ncbi:hypothetical protein A8W25_13695 [Streptomyces sp. ERV7]|uniref:vanadium-dependent haloperoxidase n=1 Tax=Streptomyces sp. ERV7 TaxID=1322334 RepID=UPI0007F370A8|nr:vanadium-dependent haloperoxidase [Streptomyces sp. ERV7]OAR23590.1 hypothetical protein A8W25_13695 [Streptomyces sp. ERV7]
MDQILFWNAVALEADRTTHTTGAPAEAGTRGPCGASRALALTHLAMHDAYFAIHPGHDCYLGDSLPEAPVGASSDAAIAAAAHATLSVLYPTQKEYFNAQHRAAGLPTGQANSDGHGFGLRVAAVLRSLRGNDPGLGDDGYVHSVDRLHHRPDPVDPGQSVYAAYYGARSHLFAATTRHHLDAPPQPGTPKYRAGLREVRAKGIATHLMGALPEDLRASRRTPQETAIGMFWAYDGVVGLGTPPRFYNQIVRKVAQAQHNDTAQNARLFALLNAAMADAGILAWTDKYIYDLWRPVVGIREHGTCCGPAGTGAPALSTDADPEWLPLGAPNSNNPGGKVNRTPNFPSYPSGHATFGAAAFQSVRQFYRHGHYGPDNLTAGLEFVSDELNGTTTDPNGVARTRVVRTFPGGLWDMIRENSLSRVFLGVHWNYDGWVPNASGDMDLSLNIGGVRLGLDIANDIATHGLRASRAAGPAA